MSVPVGQTYESNQVDPCGEVASSNTRKANITTVVIPVAISGASSGWKYKL